MNLPTALLLTVALIVFAPTALALLLLAGVAVADRVRLILSRRRAMRQLDELLMGES